MSGSVLANGNTVVSKYKHTGHAHKSGKTHAALHIVAEHEKRTAERAHTAVNVKSVDDCAHCVFAHAEHDVAADGIFRSKVAVRALCLGGLGKVCRAADEGRIEFACFLEHLSDGVARCVAVTCRKRKVNVDVVVALHCRFKLFCFFGVGFLVGFQCLFPLGICTFAAFSHNRQFVVGFLRNFEGCVFPAEVGAKYGGLFVAEGRAVAVAKSRKGAAETDYRLDFDKGRLVRAALSALDCLVDLRKVITVGYTNVVEAHCFVLLFDVLGVTVGSRSVQLHVVAVVQKNEFVEFVVTRNGNSFLRDTFLQVAVTAHNVCVMVYKRQVIAVKLCRKETFRHGKTDAHCNALTKGTGGSVDTGGNVHFGVTGSSGMKLTKTLDVVDTHAEVHKVQQRIQHRYAVSSAKNKSVAVNPVKVIFVRGHKVFVQVHQHRCCAKADTGVTAFCLVDCVYRQHAHCAYCRLFHFFLLNVFLPSLFTSATKLPCRRKQPHKLNFVTKRIPSADVTPTFRQTEYLFLPKIVIRKSFLTTKSITKQIRQANRKRLLRSSRGC